MTTGLILILAILFIGGGIATLGDRIGTRVGKARLSLFNLRPKNTAVLVTIFTGSIISASTLAILFAADEGLRTGVFELEKIEGDLRAKRQELESQRQQLETTSSQKSRVERELAEAKIQQQAQKIEAQKQQAAAQQRLAAINQLLKVAIARQSATQAQLKETTIQKAQTQGQLAVTQNQLSQVSGQFEQAKSLLTNVSQQAKTLREEVKQRQIEKQKLVEQAKGLLAERDRELSNRAAAIKQRDLDIAARDQVITQREARLKELEKQQTSLEQQVANLGQSYQDLRLGKLALSRGQVLAAETIRIQPPSTSRTVVIQLLQQANKNASDALTQPGTKPVNEQVLQISEDQVDQLVKQINDGKEYILRILSARNYVKGEKKVQVFTDVARNQLLFQTGDVVATITANPRTMTADQLQERLDTLLFASQFRARRAGIIEDRIQIGTGLEPYLLFLDKLKQYGQPVEIKAIVAEDIYTLGPLKVHLVAIQNGQIVFGT